MKVRVLVSFFSEKLSGTQDEIMNITDEKILSELLQAGYVESVETKENVSGNPSELRLKKKK